MVYKFFKWCGVFAFMLMAIIVAASPLPSIKGNILIVNPHPFFISVTEITHNKADKTLEISCKLFFDDFEKVLSAKNKTAVDLTNPKDKKAVDKMVADYLQQHLKLKIDGRPVVLTVLGYEKEREAAWCYLQVDNIVSVKKIEVFNDIFYADYATEVNLIHAIVGGERKSTRLNNPNTNAVFEF